MKVFTRRVLAVLSLCAMFLGVVLVASSLGPQGAHNASAVANCDSAKNITGERWTTNQKLTTSSSNSFTINSCTVATPDGSAVQDLASAHSGYTFWKVSLKGKDSAGKDYGPKQTTSRGNDQTTTGTEVTRFRYVDGNFQLMINGNWSTFTSFTNLQVVFYYLQNQQVGSFATFQVSDWFENDLNHNSNSKAVIAEVVDAQTGEQFAKSSTMYYNKGNAGVRYIRINEDDLSRYEVVSVQKYKAKSQSFSLWTSTEKDGSPIATYASIHDVMSTRWDPNKSGESAGYDPPHVVFTINVRKTARVSLVKQLADDAQSQQHSTSVFSFIAQVTLPNGSQSTLRTSYPATGLASGTSVAGVISQDGKSVSLSGIQAKPGQKVTIQGLPDGASVKFTETGCQSSSSASCGNDPSMFETVYENDGDPSRTDGSAVAVPESDEAGEDKLQTVTATNTVSPWHGKLTVTKTFTNLNKLNDQERMNLRDSFHISIEPPQVGMPPVLMPSNATQVSPATGLTGGADEVTYTWTMEHLATGVATLTEHNYQAGERVGTYVQVNTNGIVVANTTQAVVETEKVNDVKFINNYDPTDIYITGHVYNDATASAVLGTFAGLGGQVIDLYSSVGKLIGTATTADDGSYNLVGPSIGTYYVRLVQPNVNGVNAYQTWASATDGADSGDKSTVACVNIDGAVVDSSSAAGVACQGAQRFPYRDANPPLDGSGAQKVGEIDAHWKDGADSQPSWAHYGTVTVSGANQTTIPAVNFAVSAARGSYGDASGSTPGSTGPFNTTTAQQGPFFKNPNVLTGIFKKADGLQLGDKLGDYSDGLPDPNANSSAVDALTDNRHTETDDGIEVVLPADMTADFDDYCKADAQIPTSTFPLQGRVLSSGFTYCIRATVGGDLAAKDALNEKPSVVLGWQSDIAANKDGGWTGVNSPLAYAQWVGGADGKGDTSGTYAKLTVPSTTRFSQELYPVQTRFAVMSYDFFVNNGGNATSLGQSRTKQDNTTGIYNGPARLSDAANTQYWVQPGEVEDYQYLSPLNTPTLRLIAKVGDTDLVQPPLNVKYQLALDTEDTTTLTSDEITVASFGQPVSSDKEHVVQSQQGKNGVIVTTGLPEVQKGKFMLDRQAPLACKGSYVDSSSTIVTVPIPVSAGDPVTVPQPSDQESSDKTNVSYRIDTDASALPQGSQSSYVITCQFNYIVDDSLHGGLPEAGAFPWLSTTGVVLLTVGTFTGAAYVVVWNRKRQIL